MSFEKDTAAPVEPPELAPDVEPEATPELAPEDVPDEAGPVGLPGESEEHPADPSVEVNTRTRTEVNEKRRGWRAISGLSSFVAVTLNTESSPLPFHGRQPIRFVSSTMSS